MGKPSGAGLATVEQHGRRILCFGAGGSLDRFGRPEIFNTDQGSQFTSAAFTGVLAASGIRISMDGRGRWMDNVLIERLWRSLKYEDIYLKGYADGHGAKAGIAEWDPLLQQLAPTSVLAKSNADGGLA